MGFKKLEKLVSGVNKASEFLLGVVVIIMFFILLAQIFSRFVFFIPLPSSQDLLIFFLLVSVFLGATVAVPRGKHISIEFLLMLVPERYKKLVLAVVSIISIGFLCVVAYQALTLIGMNKGASVGASPIPLGGYYFVVAVGCLLMVLNYIIHLIRSTEAFVKGEEE